MSSSADASTTLAPEELEKLNFALLDAAKRGDLDTARALVEQGAEIYFQEEEGGSSVMMWAAGGGHTEFVQFCLEHNAPWNAVDRRGLCAGQYALNAGHQAIVDMLVDAGVRAELLFSALEREERMVQQEAESANKKYLSCPVRYEGDSLLDEGNRGVMMEWERPLMEAHAQILCERGGDILNVGFGMGIIDTAIQQYKPKSHTIIEAHPVVYQRMLADGWDKKPGVRILFGRWQDVIKDAGQFDAIFFDTFDDVGNLHEFHVHLPQILRPQGIYSFFNGICPDNVFFQGVACQVIKVQLEELGFGIDFHRCEIDCSSDKTWEGVQFRYFQDDQYFLPLAFHLDSPPPPPMDLSAAQEE